jgi:hypothetical protein
VRLANRTRGKLGGAMAAMFIRKNNRGIQEGVDAEKDLFDILLKTVLVLSTMIHVKENVVEKVVGKETYGTILKTRAGIEQVVGYPFRRRPLIYPN